jgi:hypothetical protein
MAEEEAKIKEKFVREKGCFVPTLHNKYIFDEVQD